MYILRRIDCSLWKPEVSTYRLCGEPAWEVHVSSGSASDAESGAAPPGTSGVAPRPRLCEDWSAFPCYVNPPQPSPPIVHGEANFWSTGSLVHPAVGRRVTVFSTKTSFHHALYTFSVSPRDGVTGNGPIPAYLPEPCPTDTPPHKPPLEAWSLSLSYNAQ